MSDPLARLKAANATIAARDEKLREELAERRAVATTASEGGLPAAEAAVVEGVPVNAVEFAQETIVRRTGRPVLAVVRSHAHLVFSDPESHVWKERLERASAPLALAAAAVGRIEVNGHRLAWVGTGWFVADDVVVTNRHVASEFARQRGAEFVFRRGVLGLAMTASIDLLEEIDRAESLAYRFERVLHIEDEEGPDIAFIRVAPAAGQTPPPPIALASVAVEADEAIAVIGYPARDSRIPDLQLMDQIFGNVYDKKRLAPGLIMRADERRIQHDCSTLGGNSGSVLVSLRTGEAVGIHFAGTFLTHNVAVPGATIRARLDGVLAGRHVVKPAPEPQTQSPIDILAPSGAASTTSWNIPLQVTVQVGAPVPSEAGNQRSSRITADHGKRSPVARRNVSAVAEAIPWSADMFSGALFDAAARHDYAAQQALVGAFVRHAANASSPYSPSYARRDLATLRRSRQFTLMKRYAEAVLRSGTSDPQVRRQYGQALVEDGSFERAREVLDPILTEKVGDADEEAEARGLIGRSWKQEYVNAPAAPGADQRLANAVAAYAAVYDQDPTRVWHGINVVSCTLRAVRDQKPWAKREPAVQIAEKILAHLEKRQQNGPLNVWDYAARVEALIALDRRQEAAKALNDYLSHPDLDAFEVSSTHRQFAEVLQLEPSDEIMRRLWEAVERTRAASGGERT